LRLRIEIAIAVTPWRGGPGPKNSAAKPLIPARSTVR
jgi:hypothetical protein